MDDQISSPVSKNDRISALPDEIISIILSKLSVEESARTSILSKRWPKMWLFSPINVSDESIIMNSSTYSGDCFSSVWIVNVMSHIISTHPGPVHSCHFGNHVWVKQYETLVKLLRTLIEKGIQNLLIDIVGVVNFLELPPFVLECKSLAVVKLGLVSIVDQLPASMDIFPSVKKLTMLYCYLSDGFMVNLLRSESIVKLELYGCDGFEKIVIESGSLRKIFIDADEFDTELIVKDAQNLESFECCGLNNINKVMVLNAPNLKVLSCIDMDILTLQLGNHQFKSYNKYMKTSGQITCIPSLRSLKIVVHGYVATTLPHFLMCFPRLETLEVKMIGEDICPGYGTYSSDVSDAFSSDGFDTSSSDTDSSDTYNSVFSHTYNYVSSDSFNDDAAAVDAATVVFSNDAFHSSSDGYSDDNVSNAAAAANEYDNHFQLTSNFKCLSHNLRNLRVIKYSGRQAHLDFVKLIIANARVLETVTLVCDYTFYMKRIEAQRQFLMQDRASEMLKVEFLTRN